MLEHRFVLYGYGRVVLISEVPCYIGKVSMAEWASVIERWRHGEFGFGYRLSWEYREGPFADWCCKHSIGEGAPPSLLMRMASLVMGHAKSTGLSETRLAEIYALNPRRETGSRGKVSGRYRLSEQGRELRERLGQGGH